MLRRSIDTAMPPVIRWHLLGSGRNTLELFHFRAASGNFGDDLNHWIWDEILPGWREALPGHLLVGVGTLINNKLPRGVPKIVLGSGVGYGNLPDAALMSECRFVAVRGPRSAAALGLPAEIGTVDPAVLIADLPEFQNIPKSGRPVFVPHHASVHRMDWKTLCDRAEVEFVSPEWDAKQVIRKLAAAPLVIAESMHAVILADAFGTPWTGVSVSHLFNGAKWLDWADSVGVIPRIQPLYPAMDRLRALLPVSPNSVLSGRSGQGSMIQGPAAPLVDTREARTHQGPLPLHLKIRIAMERPQTVSRFKALARQTGQLSDRSCLEAAKRRYRAALSLAFGAAS